MQKEVIIGSAFKFKANEQVVFQEENITGVGMIVGCASGEMPAIGRKWIIKLEDPAFCGINIKDYPYNTIAVFENRITSLKNKEGFTKGEYVAWDRGMGTRVGKFISAEGKYANIELKGRVKNSSNYITAVKKVRYSDLMKVEIKNDN